MEGVRRWPGRWSLGRFTLGLLFAGTLVSILGDSVAMIGLTLTAAERHSGLLVAATLIAELLPAVVLGTVAGRLADRIPLRPTWIAALLAQGVGAVLAAVVPGLWAKVTMIAVIETCGLLSAGAGFKSIKVLAGEHYAHYNSWLGPSRWLGKMLGAAVGGLGLSVLSLTGLLVTDAASFVFFAALTAVVTTPLSSVPLASSSALEMPPGSAADGPHPSDHPAGSPEREKAISLLRHVFGGANLTLLVVITVVFSLEGVASVLYLKNTVGLDNATYGLILACWPLGAAISPRIWKKRQAANSGPLVAPSCLLVGVAVAGIGLLASPWGLAAVYVGGGLANGLLSVAINNLLFQRCPEQQLATASSTFDAVTNAGFLTGYVGAAVFPYSPGATLIAAGTAAAAMALAAVPFTRTMERLRSPANAG